MRARITLARLFTWLGASFFVPLILLSGCPQPAAPLPEEPSVVSPIDVGYPGLNSVGQADVEVDKLQRITVAYCDSNTAMVRVVRLNEDGWESLGGDLSVSGATNLYLAVDSTSRPVIAFNDPAVGGRISVKRFEDDTWEQLGTGITTNDVEVHGLEVLADDTPVVLFIDWQDDGNGGRGEFIGASALVHTATPEETDATSNDGWTWLGVPGFSQDDPLYGSQTIPRVTTFISDRDETGVWVTYNNGSDKGLAREWNASEWDYLGPGGTYTDRGYSPGPIVTTTAPDGRRVVMFNGGETEFGLITRVLNDGEWTDLGARVPLDSNTNVRAGIVRGPGNVLSRAYTVAGATAEIVLERLNSTEWTYVTAVPIATDNPEQFDLSGDADRTVLWYVLDDQITLYSIED